MLSAGHGKSNLDSEFTHPKEALRNRARLGGAVGSNERDPTTGTGSALSAVDYLGSHWIFSPQYERQISPSAFDPQGFVLLKRYAKYAHVEATHGM